MIGTVTTVVVSCIMCEIDQTLALHTGSGYARLNKAIPRNNAVGLIIFHCYTIM